METKTFHPTLLEIRVLAEYFFRRIPVQTDDGVTLVGHWQAPKTTTFCIQQKPDIETVHINNKQETMLEKEKPVSVINRGYEEKRILFCSCCLGPEDLDAILEMDSRPFKLSHTWNESHKVTLMINGTLREGRVDPKATWSILKPNCRKEGELVKLYCDDVEIKPGVLIPVLGMTHVEFGWGSEVVSHPVFLAEIQHDFIVGKDLVRKFADCLGPLDRKSVV